jgi:hypothetical protein
MEVAAVQLIAYTSLTIASITVAVTTAFIGYRQLYGWRPTVIVTGVACNFVEVGKAEAITTFEVWNRRKYPIAISGGSSVAFGEVMVGDTMDGDWQNWRNTMCYYGEKIRLEPLTHQEFQISANLKVVKPKDVPDAWVVEVKYYDPQSNKEVKITAPVHYLQPRGK